MPTISKDDVYNGVYVTTPAAVVMAVPPGSDIGVTVTHDDVTPSAGNFTAAVTNLCTLNSHGFQRGLKVQLTTTTTLPGGLSLLTDYFVIPVATNTFMLASSLANANNSIAVDITDTGTGTHTITPVTGGTRNFALSFSIDGDNYSNVVSCNNSDMTVAAVSISASKATKIYSFSNLQGIRFVKLALTLGDGAADIAASMCAKN